MINTDFAYEEAMQHVRTPKVILEGDGRVCEKKILDIVAGFTDAMTLMSVDGKVFFKWTIRQSPKELIKLSLNEIDKDSNIGVFRVDYVAQNVRHQNPMEMTDGVPDCLKPYCGIEINGSHAHFNVAGYKSLVWAIPLSDLEYDVKSINDESGAINIVDAIFCFAKYINITMPIEAQPTLL